MYKEGQDFDKTAVIIALVIIASVLFLGMSMIFTLQDKRVYRSRQVDIAMEALNYE